MHTIERTLFPALKRALADQRIVVITGMRRVGKTTTVRWLLDQVPSMNKIYMDLERVDQRLVFQETNYELVLNYFKNTGLDLERPLTVALDEIQYAPNLPSVVKYLYDHHGIKFILTGSSSYYLKDLFSESMAGRKVIFELFPLGFGEFLDFRGIPYRRRQSLEEMCFDPLEFTRLKGHYDEFITYGGLPNVVIEPGAETKIEILRDIYSSYINIDVKAMADLRKLGELQQLLGLLALRIGNKLNLSKLSLILGISRPTLNAYLEFLERSYMIYRLPAYTGTDRSAALSKKLYFLDNGMASILAHPGDGALFENAVLNQLKAYGQLAYLSGGSNDTADFILTPPDGHITALETKLQPVAADEQKLKRITRQNAIDRSWIVGRYPTPGYKDFLWGGSLF